MLCEVFRVAVFGLDGPKKNEIVDSRRTSEGAQHFAPELV